MRSFQVCTCGEPLQCNEYPTPQPTGTEVLLKVVAAGVCHSDLHLSDGYFDLGGGKRMSLLDRGMKLPVDARPRECRRGGGGRTAMRSGVKVGDRACWSHPWIGCGVCPVCKRGEEQSLHASHASIGVFRPTAAIPIT